MGILWTMIQCGQSPNAAHPTPPSLVGTWESACAVDNKDKSGFVNGSTSYTKETLTFSADGKLLYERADYGVNDITCASTNPKRVSEYYLFDTKSVKSQLKDSYGIDLVPEPGKIAGVAKSGLYKVNQNKTTDATGKSTTTTTVDLAVSDPTVTTTTDFTQATTYTYTAGTTYFF